MENQQKKGRIQVFAKNIRGNANGGILEESKVTKNTAGGRQVQNGQSGGVNHNVNQPRKETLKVIKVEGPFDENNKLVDSVEKGKWYTYKAKFNREPEKDELKILKWASEYNFSGRKNILHDVSNKEMKEIVHQVQTPSNAHHLKIFAFLQTPDVHAKAEIMQGEILIVVGTEQHSQNYGNKLMFPAQAVREIRQYYKDHKHANIVIFTDQFTDMQLSIIKRDAKNWNSNLYFKKLNTVTELINYINNGDATVDRSKTKVATLKIFAHGLPKVLDFGLDGDNEEAQRFKNEHVSQLKKESFAVKPEIFSYACRTGNSDDRYVTLNPKYEYDAEALKLVKPEESLAQKLADHLDAKVYAYLRRSNYTSTWNDGGNKDYKAKYMTIEDESVSSPFNPKDWYRSTFGSSRWDESLWNPEGAFLLPTSGSSPGGLLQGGMFIFEKSKTPVKQ
ncbi:hypothetical protein [Chryseobacterium sp.]|uniref:hypothetical protein n=1 Tax=Chryseobacterium sp. TaxID=1871047 RepID=UPI0028A0F3B7|nr:hypothetical protein [Chryseobacterium sp.]